MGEEIMSEWIKECVDREKQRRKDAKAFMDAAKLLIDDLTDRITSAVEEFREQFPGEYIQIERRRPYELTVTHSYNPNPDGAALISVRIYADPIARTFVYEIPLSTSLGDSFPARVEQGELVLDVSHNTVSKDSLVECLLIPVLFPGICDSDAGVKRYLQQQLGFH
jgi:hypothetical protein